MSQAQYAAIVARQRNLQQNRMPSQKEVKHQENDSDENAVIAIRELNEKVSQKKNPNKDLSSALPSAIPKPVPPSNFPVR